MNLHGYLTKSPEILIVDNLRYWSAAFRPLGGVYYVALYRLFGFNPLPFRVGCFVLLAVNLAVLYQFCRVLSGSEEVAYLATLLASYHAWFVDLYDSSGTVYKLLCFAFCVSAYLYYICKTDREAAFGL